MSEKIFAILLRLYPARFRQRYQAEALQLFRDRMHASQGVRARMRLWMDLIADSVVGLRQAYRNSYPVAVLATDASGIPAFRTLEEEPLRPGSIVMGGISATAALAFFIFIMSHASAPRSWGQNQRLRAASAGSMTNPDAQDVAEALQRKFEGSTQQQLCSFEKLELHPGNIGYVKLSWFADPAMCGDVADAVMQRLGETDAVIFDLRDAHGGHPEMVRRMAGWLFDHPVAWYNPRATSAAQRMTAPNLESRLAFKPVFVLTSWRTFSGAEHFAYNLKTLKRATIVGERTSGASHAGGGPPIAAALSEPKPVWEGPGVQPDVKVAAGDALVTAEKLALQATHNQ